MTAYGELCTEFYDLDKPVAPPDALAFYVDRARTAGGRVLEPMCGSGRFLLPMVQAGLTVEGVDSSSAMLDACHRRASDLGLAVSLYRLDIESMTLPHRYGMAFVPSGSIGLVTIDAALRRVLNGLHSCLQPLGTLLLEVMDIGELADNLSEHVHRTVTCPDGATISYRCLASRLRNPEAVLFSGTYHKRQGNRQIAIESEELLLREYRLDELAETLIDCGFRVLKVVTSAELGFLAEGGCHLIEARADA